MHYHFRRALLFIISGLFGFTSLGNSQDIIDPLNEESYSLGPELLTFIIVLVTLAILFVVFFLGFQMFRKQRTFDETIQALEWNLDQIKEEAVRRFDSIQNASRDNDNRLKETESQQSSILNNEKNIRIDLEQTNIRINNIDTVLENLKSDIEIGGGAKHPVIDYQKEAEKIIQQAQAQVSELAHAYKDGEPINFVDIQSPTPSQNVLLILNWIARNLSTWITELEQSPLANSDLIQILGNAEQSIKNKLKTIRGEVLPLPTPLEIETEANTDTELNEIQIQRRIHIACFEGILSGYQLRCPIDTAEYNQFIPQFIRDQLFNSIAGLVQFDQMPEQLDKFLQLVGYAVIPIEIDKTKVDSSVHDIQGSRQVGVEPGTIIEVILPGLRRKIDGEIIQKSVVIRGE